MITLKTAKSLNRATIADGKLLQHYVFLPLSANDDALLAYLNTTYNKLLPLYTTVNTCSSDWRDDKIYGFSAITFGSNKEEGTSKFAERLYVSSTDDVTISTYRGNPTFKVPYSAYGSFYALAMAGDSYIDNKKSVALNMYSSATNNSFACGYHQVADKHSMAFGKIASTARNYSFSVNHGNIYDIQYKVGSFVAENSAVSFYGNYITGGESNIGLYANIITNSKYCLAIHDCDIKNSQNTFAKNYASANNVLDSIAKNYSFINTVTSTLANNYSSAYNSTNNSLANNRSCLDNASYSLALNNSTIKNTKTSIAVNESKLTNAENSIGINNSTVTGLNNFAFNSCQINGSGNFCVNACTATTDDNMLFNRCKATFQYAGIKHGSVFAINNCDASEGYASLLCNSSSADGFYGIGVASANVGGNSFAAYKSTADTFSIAFSNSTANKYSIATHDSDANSKSIASYNSTATVSSIAFYNSSADMCSLAIDNSTAADNSIAYNSSFASANSIALLNSTAHTRSIAILNSYAGYEELAINNNKFRLWSEGVINRSFGIRYDIITDEFEMYEVN